MYLTQTKFIACIIAGLSWFGCSFALTNDAPVATTQPEIIAVFPERFPPIYNVTVNNIPTGFGIDVLDAVAHRAGLKIKFVPVDSWEEATKRLRNGSADIIPDLGITHSRKSFATFTRPIHNTSVSLLVLDDAKPFSTLSDLRNTHFIVGVVASNVGVAILAREPDIRSKIFPTLTNALLELDSDKIDALIYPDQIAEQMATNLRLKNNLKAVGTSIEQIPRAIAVSKNKPALLKKLDSALATFLITDRYTTIYRRWYPEPVYWNQKRAFYLAGLFIFFGLAAIIYFRVSVLRNLNNELSRSNTFVKTVLDIAAEGILTLDQAGIIQSVNKAAENIFGRDANMLVNSSIKELMPEIEAEEFIKTLAAHKQEDSGIDLHANDQFREYRFKTYDGRLFPVRIALKSAHINQSCFFICTIEDVSQLREAQRLADFHISHDQLTGLVNQNGFSILLKTLLSQTKRYKRSLSCLHIDIDRMHAINNTYGYDVGDKMLIQFSRRLESIVRESDLLGAYSDNMLARIGGNRFIVILPETDTDMAVAAAMRISSEIEKLPFHTENISINISCKIGIASYPSHGSTPQELLSHSEAALRVAKSDARIPYHIYVEAEDKIEKHTDAWVDKIISGLREDRFFLLFQPILDIKSGKIRHFEALVRYQDNDGKIISPNEFIPIAERYGSIKQLDRRVMELAISHLAGLEAAGQDIAIAINLSGANIGDGEIFGWLEMLLEENELDPKHIIFEITETASLLSITSARSFIDSIKALGCRIALDDFGTGLSSFTYLRNFPVDILKIDGSFIRNLPNSHEDRVMVRSMVNVAHSLGKQVVAEFVSTQEIYDIIQGFGVDYAQGYYISEPVPLHDFMVESKYFGT